MIDRIGLIRPIEYYFLFGGSCRRIAGIAAIILLSMQLYYFLAVILSLTFGSLPSASRPIAYAFTFTGLVILSWWVLCFLSVRLVTDSVNKGDIGIELGLRWFDRQLEWFRWLSLGLIALCLGGFGFGAAVSTLPLVGESNTVRSVLLLLPGIAVMFGLWAAEFQFAVRLGILGPGWFRGARFVLETARASVAWMLVPVIGFMLAVDLLELLPVSGELPPWSGFIVIGLMVLVLLPQIIKWMLPTRVMEFEDRKWFQSLLGAGGIPGTGVVIWNTRGQMFNAMVAGFVRRFRLMIVTDRLLAELPREEQAMVVLHEIAHVRRHHVPLRILSLLPAWLLGFSLERVCAGQVSWQFAQQYHSIIGCLVTIALTAAILRVVSHWIEFDADRFACQLALEVADGCDGVPGTERQARVSLASALARVTPDREAAERGSWLHPAISERVGRLLSPFSAEETPA